MKPIAPLNARQSKRLFFSVIHESGKGSLLRQRPSETALRELGSCMAGAKPAERTEGIYSLDGGNGPSFCIPVRLIK